MKTVADLKRAIKKGIKLSSTYHLAFGGRDEQGNVIYKDEYKGIREVSIVQSTQFALKTMGTDGSYADSWMTFPKLKEVKFNDDGSFTILKEDHRDASKMIPVITYAFQPETASQVEFNLQSNVKTFSICLLFLFAGLASCNTEPVTRSGYPVVNDLRPGKSPWLLTSTSISETAEDLAAGNWRIDSADLKGKHTHFYYAKGDSTRHIVTYQGRIVSDKRGK